MNDLEYAVTHAELMSYSYLLIRIIVLIIYFPILCFIILEIIKIIKNERKRLKK